MAGHAFRKSKKTVFLGISGHLTTGTLFAEMI